MQSKRELVDKIMQEQPDISQGQIQKMIQFLSQLSGCRLFSTINQDIDEERWLQARTAGIGGSDIAAIMDMNPWSSPREIWLSKTGQFAPEGQKQSEAARWGNVLETVVAEEWAFRNDKKWVHIPVTLQSIQYPWMLANIDGFILDDTGENITGVLEVKTTNSNNRNAWENGPIPIYYLCQANWYTYITGLDNFTIICLVGGQQLYEYEMPLDTKLVGEMIEASKEFWLENVGKMIEPKATAGDIDAMKQLIVDTPEDPEEAALILLDDESDRLVGAYIKLRSKITELDKVRKAVYAQLLDMMQGRTEALTATHTLSLGTSQRRSCDYDLLESLYPEAYAECIKFTQSSTLRVK